MIVPSPNKDRISALVGPACFVVAGGLAVATAIVAALAIERRSTEDILTALEADGIQWVDVSANGLQVFLDGTAPDEALRFRAQTGASAIVDSDRVINRLDVAALGTAAPPRFSLDMLRNGDGIQLIGLIPGPEGDEAFAVAETIADIAGSADVVNMVEMADLEAPENWDEALAYGLRALAALPRSKVTVLANRVEVEAVGETREERAEFIARLQQNQPAGVEIVLDISAPRPVITPFSLRFVRDDSGARFETCTADTQAAHDQIVAAGQAAGTTGNTPCTIGLGVPSPSWGNAVATSLEALTELGNGSVTLSDADVTLIAAQGTSQELFDTVVGELDADLPAVFSLQAILPEPELEAAAAGPARFTATFDQAQGVRLRGRLPGGAIGQSVQAFAAATFGAGTTDIATREVADLPQGWSIRVMAGLTALSQLEDGVLTIEPDTLRLSGRTGDSELISALTRQIAEDLGPGAIFDMNVAYDEALDPVASQPTPQECEARIRDIQDETKITFDPGSTEINRAAGEVLDEIAEILPDCMHVSMEIGGHTDAQGGETMNLNLSQSRANAVLNGLLARGVLVSNLAAQGYGESQPIADNETEDGREQNRRIEFRLLADAEVAGLAADVDDQPRTRAGILAEGAIADWPFELRPLPRPEPPIDDE
ncbi:OmpA family protein [Jannaschia sp. CCS1]|uniref:OmpA family protein n=1 Tax=Jannaschia sp. (strain CCS1) TaxID=290400 RepID=UPI000053AFE3|nr:OmpA family protein [Jannaschia sp. CCS1]ABD56831.1 OmpA/MotB [Jannaschia sp. CCS1]